MKLTPAIKGQLTKAVKAHGPIPEQIDREFHAARFNAVLAIFVKHMPKEQAKHTTKKYLATL